MGQCLIGMEKGGRCRHPYLQALLTTTVTPTLNKKSKSTYLGKAGEGSLFQWSKNMPVGMSVSNHMAHKHVGKVNMPKSQGPVRITHMPRSQMPVGKNQVHPCPVVWKQKSYLEQGWGEYGGLGHHPTPRHGCCPTKSLCLLEQQFHLSVHIQEFRKNMENCPKSLKMQWSLNGEMGIEE